MCFLILCSSYAGECAFGWFYAPDVESTKLSVLGISGPRYCRVEANHFCFALSKLLSQGICEHRKCVIVKFGILYYAAILPGHVLSDLGEIFLYKQMC